MVSPALFSSSKDEWGTPQPFFDYLNEVFRFSLDPCAHNADIAKVSRFITPEENGLEVDWTGHRSFVNPPYSDVSTWVRKCYETKLNAADNGRTKVVALVTARTDTKWWHDYAMMATRIMLVKGRIKFQGAANGAPFPSAVLVYDSAFRSTGVVESLRLTPYHRGF